jgi:hypothetical protein
MYSPQRELSLDEGMIPWTKFRLYIPREITKYVYICSMEIFKSKRERQEDTIYSVSQNNMDLSHHIYQYNFYI